MKCIFKHHYMPVEHLAEMYVCRNCGNVLEIKKVIEQ